MPGAKQPCPTVAACWSPAMPRMRIGPPNSSGRCRSRRRNRAPPAAAPAGTSNNRQSSASQLAAVDVEQQGARRHWWRRSRAPCRRSAATAGSCPPCRTQAAPLAPPRARPRRGRAARRSWWRRNTDRAAARCAPRSSGSCPAAAARRSASAVRRSCQTMALWIGWPVARSQTIVVSRWLVMPSAAMSLALSAGLAPCAARTVATSLDQISSGSCSTRPGAG